MRTGMSHRCASSTSLVVLLAALFFCIERSDAADLKVMKSGLGSGTITSSPAGINCGVICDATFGSTITVTLTASPAAGSVFVGWDLDPDGDISTTPDCTGVSTCVLTMAVNRAARPVFDLSPAIPTLSSFTPSAIQSYLTANPNVNSPARFINALPSDFKQNWILMSRSESVQTGTAQSPRILLPNADARFVFSIGAETHGSYPGAHPNAIEYMQWDDTEKNFRFHEIVLDAIPPMGSFPARGRGVSIDDSKCSRCHSTRNVLNLTTSPGTTGIPPGTIKTKNKPNWDSYDSWAGMLPFNRDRVYQGSVEAAAFRKIFNPWTWRTNDPVRAIIEQLKLQPSGAPAGHVITRLRGGTNDGFIKYALHASPPVLTEPPPSGSAPAITTPYSFDGSAGTGTPTSVTRGGTYITLHHQSIPTSDEGRCVHFFDLLGGLAGNLNPQRIADELVNHRFATGSVPIDVRPIALAITKRCLSINSAANTVTSGPGLPALSIDLSFFNARNGMTINDLVANTTTRAQSLPRRKADIERINLDRTNDPYLFPTAPANGLIQQYGAGTSAGTDLSPPRLRQEVFRRPIDAGSGDATVMGGIYVDRELYSYNTNRIALYRYFLEPLGVSVDKWSMGVRGRSRTYTFADVLGSYDNVLETELQASLTSDPVAGLSPPFDCSALIPAVNSTLGSLPAADAVPTFTDVQRIFNKSCIECHDGLGYPPYGTGSLNFSEDELLTMGARLARPYAKAVSLTTSNPTTSLLYQKITETTEACSPPSAIGLMPCGGPPLSKVDIETIRRWIVGPPSRPSTVGDPHIRTVDGINYDFQSAGEFVLLRDEGLEIQARQSPVATEAPLPPHPYTGLASCVSLNTAVAVRVGAQRITYQPNVSGKPDPEGLQLRIDGKLTTLSVQGIALGSGGRIIRTRAPGGIQIEAPGGTAIVVTPAWWDHYQLWYMNIDVQHPRATQGVMGTIPRDNWLPALPDGTLLGPKPRDLHQRYLDLYVKFQNAWRVSNASTLFDYAPGTSTRTFTIENWPMEAPQSCPLPPQPEGPPAIPPIKPLPLEVAKQHCRAIAADDHRANCEQDVMVTGEPGFAKTYLLAEEIDRNAKPSAPTLVFPENNASLALPIKFTWNTTTDPDGDVVTYRQCVWVAGDLPTFNECDATPIKATWISPSVANIILLVLIICLLVAVLIFVIVRPRRALAGLAIAILAALILVIYFGSIGAKTVSKTVTELKPGK